jgi:hypothetical protein
MMLLSLRGVEKTVLLNRLFASANEMGFESIKIEGPEGVRYPGLLQRRCAEFWSRRLGETAFTVPLFEYVHEAPNAEARKARFQAKDRKEAI